MGVEGIRYGRGHGQLEKLLRSVDRPGVYCVGGWEFLPMPRVVVDGVGELSFPVPPVQVDALAEAAEPAPFGKGTRTLVDPSVRDCRQIDSSQVSLSGRVWPDSLAKILAIVAKGLGLPVERLGAELYKLLVYRRGGFFAEHRDTEKVAGMVGTLSLSLPTAGAGGEIVVRHGDDETRYDMTATEPSELAFAAFYADCPHEVLPVTEGHRVSLVFNLLLESAGHRLGAPDYSDLALPVAKYLTEWRHEIAGDECEEEDEDADKIVWLLEHEYSEAGLSFATLKNTDTAVAEVLRDAAERADCELFAAVLRVAEQGAPDFCFDDWSGWGDRDVDLGTSEFTMAGVNDRWDTLDGWAAPDGGKPPLGEVPLNPSELLPQGALDDAEPDERRLHGSTGNEGPTLEYVYRRAALVVWPREHTVDVLARGSIDGAVAWAATQIAGDDGGLATDRDVEREMEIVERLMERWPVSELGRREQDRGAMLRLMADAGFDEHAAGFLRRVVTAKYDGSENDGLAAIMPLIGAEETGDFLLGLAEAQLARQPASVVEALALGRRAAEAAAGDAEQAAWREALREAVSFVLTDLRPALELAAKERADREARDRRWFGRFHDQKAPDWIDHETVRDLFLLARPLGCTDETLAAAEAIGDHPLIVTPGRILPAALDGMREDEELARSPAYARLWLQAADFLLERSAEVPVAGQRRRLGEYAEDLEWMASLRDGAPRGKGAGVAETVDRLARALETGKAAG